MDAGNIIQYMSTLGGKQAHAEPKLAKNVFT